MNYLNLSTSIIIFVFEMFKSILERFRCKNGRELIRFMKELAKVSHGANSEHHYRCSWCLRKVYTITEGKYDHEYCCDEVEDYGIEKSIPRENILFYCNCIEDVCYECWKKKCKNKCVLRISDENLQDYPYSKQVDIEDYYFKPYKKYLKDVREMMEDEDDEDDSDSNNDEGDSDSNNDEGDNDSNNDEGDSDSNNDEGDSDSNNDEDDNGSDNDESESKSDNDESESKSDNDESEVIEIISEHSSS